MEKIKIKANENNDLKFRGTLENPNDSKNIITEETEDDNKLEYFTE